MKLPHDGHPRLRWRKSSHSTGNDSTCVEVATNMPGVVAVRDSTDPGGPMLAFSPSAWRSFTSELKAH
jgi:hypothetical protein